MKADSRGLRAALHVLAGLTVLLACAPSFGASKERLPGVTVEGSRVYDPERDGDPVINNLERRTFRFFWDTTNKQNGLAPDRYPSPSFASIAARRLRAHRLCDRRRARLRVAQPGAAAHAAHAAISRERCRRVPTRPAWRGYNGFYYHFLDMQNGQRFGTSELSTVDTALLLGGVLLAQSYFDRDTRARTEIRELAEQIYRRVDWTWAQNRPPIDLARLAARDRLPALRLARLQRGDAASTSWRSARRRIRSSRGLGGVDCRPTRTRGASSAARSSCRSARCSATSTRTSGSTSAASRTSTCASKGIDYFENSRRAAYAQREYAIAESDALARLRQRDLGPDAPATVRPTPCRSSTARSAASSRTAARGTAATHLLDDGTIAPTAAVASIAVRAGDRDSDDPRVPRALRRAPVSEVRLPRRGQPELHVHRRAAAARPDRRRTSAGSTNDYLGIDQGPIVAMIENYRSGLDLEADAAQSAHPPRPGARRLHRRLARATAAAAAARARERRWLDASSAARSRVARRRGSRRLPLGCTRGCSRRSDNVVRFWAVGREGEVAVELRRGFRARAARHRRRSAEAAVDGGAREAADGVRRRYAAGPVPARQHLDPRVRRAGCARAAR